MGTAAKGGAAYSVVERATCLLSANPRHAAMVPSSKIEAGSGVAMRETEVSTEQ